jgi:hypothetical protein
MVGGGVSEAPEALELPEAPEVTGGILSWLFLVSHGGFIRGIVGKPERLK